MRVYPINEEQYERLQKLTNGKNVISEARLTSAGFTSVRDSLDSGWNSLLRIMGLTTTTRSDASKIDIDGQPLCVMKRSLSEVQPRDAQAKEAAEEDDSVINCIVVLKEDGADEGINAGITNPNFAPYWFNGNAEEGAAEQPTEQEATPERASAVAPAADSTSAVAPMPAPVVKKTKSGTKSKRKSSLRKKNGLRQYYPQAPLPPLPPPPPPPYGAGYGSPYDNSYGQSPYNPFGSYPAPAIPPSSYPPSPYPPSSYPPSSYPPSPYPAGPSPASPYPVSPYPPASPYAPASPYPPSPYTPGAYPPASYPPPPPPPAYGPPSPYGQYPYYDKIREGDDQYDDEEEDGYEAYETYEVDGDDSDENEYYD